MSIVNILEPEDIRAIIREELDLFKSELIKELKKTDEPKPQMYSVKQASEILGLATSTIRRLIETGELPARKLGGRVFVKLSKDLI